MEEIKWSERFSVGVRALDDQHRGLIEMINTMHGKTDVGTMFDVVMQMFNYATVHFASEEKLMLAHSYPEVDQHVREHKAFLAKTTDFSGHGSRLRNSQNSRNEFVSPVRKPLTCVPPCGVGIRLT